MSALEETVVNVLRKCDKNGNSEWWLVEQDGKKGYIPESFLVEERKPLTRSASVSDAIDSPVTASTQSTFYVEKALLEISLPSEESGDTEPVDDKDTEENEVVKSERRGSVGYENVEYFGLEYDFEALHPGELNVHEGELVKVLRKYDQKGNKVWWFVEHDGKQGYVPRDYLVFVDEVQMC